MLFDRKMRGKATKRRDEKLLGDRMAVLAHPGLSILLFGVGHSRTSAYELHRVKTQTHDRAIMIWSFAGGHMLSGQEVTPPIRANSGRRRIQCHLDDFSARIGLLFSPIIWFGGPILAFNLAGLLAPAVNAFSAYLVCRLVTRTTWLAAIGGYVYGFSPYVVGHLIAAHANLFFIPWPALTVYVCALFALDRIGNVACIMLLTLAGLFQFLTSIEVFATTMVAGTIALAIFGLSASFEFRRRWLALAKNCAIAALAVATLVSPFVYRFLAQPEYVSMPVVLRFVGSPGSAADSFFESVYKSSSLDSSPVLAASVRTAACTVFRARLLPGSLAAGDRLGGCPSRSERAQFEMVDMDWSADVGTFARAILQSRGSVYSDALVDIRQASSHQDGYSGSARSVFVFGFGRDYCDDMRGVPRAKAWNSPGDIDRTGSASRFSLYRYFGTEPARSRVFPIFSSQRAYISGRDCSCTAGWRQQRCYGLASRDRYVFQPALCLYL